MRTRVISSIRGFEPADTSYLIGQAQKLSRPLLDKEAIANLCLLLLGRSRTIKRIHGSAVVALLKEKEHLLEGVEWF